MARIIKKKAFTLLELTLASALFVSAMVGVVALVASCVNTTNQTISIQSVNNTARNLNEYLFDKISNTTCFLIPQNNDTEIRIMDAGCTNVLELIYINENGVLVSKVTGQEEISQTSNDIKLNSIGDNPVFESADNLLNVNIDIASIDTKNIDLQYKTSITKRSW